MKTKAKQRLHKHLKRVHHHLTKKKVVKKRTGWRIARTVFALIVASSFSSLAFAIATTKPVVNLDLQTNLKPTTFAPPQAAESRPDQVGQASWYALGLAAPDALTCASTTFPRGTYLQVKDLRNGRTVTCLVNDYGPEAWTHRVIDLSRGSFSVLEGLGSGTIPVEIRVIRTNQSGGLELAVRNWFGQFSGYSLCQIRHSSGFCDSNRQKTWSF